MLYSFDWSYAANYNPNCL